MWRVLYEFGADVVHNGHDHVYERFVGQTPDGAADPTAGIREFVVGTGGKGPAKFQKIRANSEVRDQATYGLLNLTLYETSYDWEFVRIAGQTFSDSGTDGCVF